MSSAKRDESKYVCKHCGSDDIIAEVEIRRAEVGGKIREQDGKPVFYEDDLWDAESDVLGYVCECGASAARIEKLVVRRRAYNEMKLPCGRCDHHVDQHKRADMTNDKRFTRGPMPCTVAGCDCHDYYDQALGLEPCWDRPGQERIAA